MNPQTTAEKTQLVFDEKTVDLIRKTVAQNANDTELQLFLYYAQRTGLDPLARQIYMMKRSVRRPDGTYDSRMTIQTSIDGFRIIAARSGNYAGQGEPKFSYDSNDKNVPSCCTLEIFKFSPTGERYVAAVGTAYWDEYCPPSGQDFMWRKMPHTMLAKVSEALGLRKAFPQDLSGIYTDEEMDQAQVQNMTSNTEENIKREDKKISQQNNNDENIEDRARKWLETIPERIEKTNKMRSQNKKDIEKNNLLKELRTAKKGVKGNTELIHQMNSYISELKK